ncbi:carnosine N-methyltransferase isoform X1 [Aplysia californica]|uniref:carnosine N-methyltransferase n=1 Tax=Aplysia californica TaxID=6500 RepID=A0ABM0K9V0_APLCA|nr:carnosine N-methyltransferase isoform X1 [Aplysia californica]
MADGMDQQTLALQIQEQEEREERQHFARVINSFKYYKLHCLKRLQMSKVSYLQLNDQQKSRIPSYMDNLDTIQTCVIHNYEVIKLMLQDCQYMFLNKDECITDADFERVKKTDCAPPTAEEMNKVKTTLKQIVRDWSEDGRAEREACYQPVMHAVLTRLGLSPHRSRKPSEVKILVPGAGLGRLVFEFARLGYSCQGNEWSMHMLLASNFILNRCQERQSMVIYPWVNQFTNNLATKDQTRRSMFPDISPLQISSDADFTMVAGDFTKIYTEPNTWNAIVTVFFLDTAHNIIEYLEIIYNILIPGGYLVNLGPLLYHWEGMQKEMSVELSYEELRKVMLDIGFEIEKEEMNVRCSYTQNPLSLMQNFYNCVMFVARKPIPRGAHHDGGS